MKNAEPRKVETFNKIQQQLEVLTMKNIELKRVDAFNKIQQQLEVLDMEKACPSKGKSPSTSTG